jgi:hypothetical protein
VSNYQSQSGIVWEGRILLHKILVLFISFVLIPMTLVLFGCELPEEDSKYVPISEAEIVQEVVNKRTIAFVHSWINENNFTREESDRPSGEFEVEYQVWYTKDNDHWQALNLLDSVPSRVYGTPAVRVYVQSLPDFDIQFSYPKEAKELYVYVEMRWFSVDNPEHDITLGSAYSDFVGFDSTNSVSLD